MSPATTQSRGERTLNARYVGYAACLWALLFAALSFYWAAGGTAGGVTIGPSLERLGRTRDPEFVVILWATGALKVGVGALALALTQPWGRRFPRWALLTAAWSAVAILALYEGAASLVQHALMVSGVIATPAGLGATAARWHLYLWDPWWLLGGVLILVAAREYQRATRSVS
jgi:hypothetical protein